MDFNESAANSTTNNGRRIMTGMENLQLQMRLRDIKEENVRLSEALEEALMAILYTRDYVGEDKLPTIQGWSWYDAALNISEIIPDSDAVNQFRLRVNNETSDVKEVKS